MTASERLERQLPSILGDLAMGPYPDYVEDVLVQTGRKRQRPAWTFPERWIPMAEITTRSALAPRLPWRAIATALIILSLLVGAALVYIGSQQPKVPPPFGVARNGLMLYGSGGDIYTLDPASGVSKLVVSGPETDRIPFFSRDGTRFVFFRPHGTASTYDLVVANADGTDQRVITTDPVTLDYSFNWSADGRAMIVDDGNGHVTRLDAVGTTPPQKTTYPGVRDLIALRPPDESQLLYRAVTADGWSLWMMDVDGSHAHPVLPTGAASMREEDYVGYSWSPDGSKIAFRMHPDTSEESRIFIVNADGTGLHRLTHETGIECECDMFWSPDGTQIGFNRWRRDPSTGDWHSRPVALASVADGTIKEIGPVPTNDNGAEFAFSPDGTSMTWMHRQPSSTTTFASAPLVFDLATGTSLTIDVSVDSPPDWQRLAR